MNPNSLIKSVREEVSKPFSSNPRSSPMAPVKREMAVKLTAYSSGSSYKSRI